MSWPNAVLAVGSPPLWPLRGKERASLKQQRVGWVAFRGALGPPARAEAQACLTVATGRRRLLHLLPGSAPSWGPSVHARGRRLNVAREKAPSWHLWGEVAPPGAWGPEGPFRVLGGLWSRADGARQSHSGHSLGTRVWPRRPWPEPSAVSGALLEADPSPLFTISPTAPTPASGDAQHCLLQSPGLGKGPGSRLRTPSGPQRVWLSDTESHRL